MDKSTKYPSELITEFMLRIAELERQKIIIDNEIKVKQEFLKVLKNKQEIKMSELYNALESDINTYWTIKEIKLESRLVSFFEIKVRKKYFINTKQLQIMREHYTNLFRRSEADIRISQFY